MKVQTVQKPSAGYPLYPHKSGKWAKKIRGRVHYFGTHADPDGALREYQEFLDEECDVVSPGGVDVAGACNAFLTAKLAAVENGELSNRSYREYLRTCKRLLAHSGRDRLVVHLKGALRPPPAKHPPTNPAPYTPALNQTAHE